LKSSARFEALQAMLATRHSFQGSMRRIQQEFSASHRDTVNSDEAQPEPPPHLAAQAPNAAEWLNFFHKKNKADNLVKPGGHHSMFEAQKMKLKPIRTPRQGAHMEEGGLMLQGEEAATHGRIKKGFATPRALPNMNANQTPRERMAAVSNAWKPSLPGKALGEPDDAFLKTKQTTYAPMHHHASLSLGMPGAKPTAGIAGSRFSSAAGIFMDENTGFVEPESPIRRGRKYRGSVVAQEDFRGVGATAPETGPGGVVKQINLDMPDDLPKEPKKKEFKRMQSQPLKGVEVHERGVDESGLAFKLDVVSALNQQLQKSAGGPGEKHGSGRTDGKRPGSGASSRSSSGSKSATADEFSPTGIEFGRTLTIEGESKLEPQLKPQLLQGTAGEGLTDAEKVEILRRNQHARQHAIITGKAMGQGTEEEPRGSQTERAILPASRFATHQNQQSAAVKQQRGTAATVGALVSKVREQLESTTQHKSLAAWWLSLESAQGKERLTLGAMQKGMVEAGVNPEDAGILIQSILEENGVAGALIPGDQAPIRAQFLEALISGKLPQKAMDAAQRRLLQGTAWWSDGQLSANFRISQVQEGISSRDAQTILTTRSAQG